jgi:chromosome segregation protein
LRLQNRRAALASDADAAERTAAAARAEAETAEELLAVAVAREAEARAARRAAEAALAEAGRTRTRAEAAAEAARGRAAGLRSGRARRVEEAKAAAAGLEEARAAARGLADPAAARAALEAERVKVEAARLTMLTRRAEAAELARTGEARAARLASIAREIADWQGRRASAEARLAGLATRAAETAEALDAARAEPPALAERRARLGEALDAAEARRRAASDRLARAETTLREADAALRAAEVAAGAAREARARSEALAEAAEARATAAAERLRAEAETEPETLLGRFGADPDAVPGAGALEAEVGRLRRAREGLGAVNLRAEEDARLVAEEHATLAADRDDLEEAVRKLRQGINALNREGRGRLLAAFETVNANFATLFTRLFGGGEATLTLVESDDPLEAGLEIMCQPPGKKLTTLSLLSGGEQTLTALSLIFAVFLANPSPICVLDEVDAPLDDANVGRFCDLLDEMTERTDTRFLIITHHAVTMARMDRLFGVTMAEQGVSQLVSVDLAAAERIVEPVA